jgi:hypothetical protein
VVNVDRIAVGFEGQFDDVHGADNAGAKAAGADTYERFGSVIGAIDLGQTQFVLRKALSFYLNGRFPATSFAGSVLGERPIRALTAKFAGSVVWRLNTHPSSSETWGARSQ